MKIYSVNSPKDNQIDHLIMSDKPDASQIDQRSPKDTSYQSVDLDPESGIGSLLQSQGSAKKMSNQTNL
jgi:hypothetical protein